ncbi:MAG: BNR-4 repeat-containing protein [Sedimentisphaeraceae bacterium JB056]
MRIKTLNIIILAVVSLTLKVQSASLSEIENVFENEKCWVTAPKMFMQEKDEYMPRLEKQQKRVDWVTPGVTFEELAYGAELSDKNVKQGNYSLKWSQLNKYPTIACYEIEGDLSKIKNFSFECFSEKNTGNEITFAVLADNPNTPYLDYWIAQFKLDWTGWKRLSFNTDNFGSIGKPQSWSRAQGLFFFSKNSRRSPDPSAVLYFDDMQASGKKSVRDDNILQDEPESFIFKMSESCDEPVMLNHDSKEVAEPIGAGKPLVQQPYFQGARALHGYYPKYDPGYVSFAPEGRPFIHCAGAVEWLDEKGQWHKKDLKKAVRNFAVQNGWEGVELSLHGDRTIRFDNDGGIYVMETVSRLDKNGEETSWKDRATLLLYAENVKDSWQVYSLPGRLGCFEKIDGHNQDALNNPPVILLTDYFYFSDADHDGYLLLPKKTDDGKINLDDKICYAKNSLAGPVHSGKANFAITQGDMIFIQYSTMPPPAPGVSPTDAMSAEPVDSWKDTLPEIPADHPARDMELADRDKTVKAEGGLPCFITAYNRKTGELSEHVFLGFGGKKLDNHNWGAITVDSKGILHVIISGHIDPLLYTHSLRPGDITQWSKPVYLTKAPDSDKYNRATYPSLNCDADDNLITAFRSDTDFYNHRISFMTKPADGPWSQEKSLLVPYKDAYHVWRHGVAYDAAKDRFFAAFYEQSAQQQLKKPDYLFCRFIWPESEQEMTVNYDKKFPEDAPQWQKGNNAGLPQKGAPMFTSGTSDMTVMFYNEKDCGWQIATTGDFLSN